MLRSGCRRSRPLSPSSRRWLRRGESEAQEAQRRLADIARQLEDAPALRGELDAKGGERRALETRVAELQGEERLHSLQLEQMAGHR